MSPIQARDLANLPVGTMGPICVIDDWYLFSMPHKTRRIDLTGTYVNGKTGRIEKRKSELSLFRKDSLLGDREDMPTALSEAKVYK